MNWLNDPTPPSGAIGFIYILKYNNNTKAYIGKKNLLAKKTLPALKTGTPRKNSIRIVKHVLKDEQGKIVVSKRDKTAARKRGLKATKEEYDVLYAESNWKAYTSSSDDVKNYTLESKEILQWAYSNKELTYLENKWLYNEEVLERIDYLNSNIEGRFFKNEFNLKGK